MYIQEVRKFGPERLFHQLELLKFFFHIFKIVVLENFVMKTVYMLKNKDIGSIKKKRNAARRH